MAFAFPMFSPTKMILFGFTLKLGERKEDPCIFMLTYDYGCTCIYRYEYIIALARQSDRRGHERRTGGATGMSH